MNLSKLQKLKEYLYEISASCRKDMRVPARIYANEEILEDIKEDESLDQLVNISTLPGIQKYAIAMPDIHEGYGFPIGGVAATRISDGVISPGGVGFDINCGVRLLSSSLSYNEIKPHLLGLANQTMRDVPSGVGRGGDIKFSTNEMDKILKNGARALLKGNYAVEEDLKHLESEGGLEIADSRYVSERAKSRGRDQLGTLGSGNHFLEFQKVEEIFDEEVAKVFNLQKNGVTIMIHTGSRGLGHQVCTDYVRIMLDWCARQGIKLPDKELAYAPVKSDEGQKYLVAMSAAANFAWANRQMLTWRVRKAWNYILGKVGMDIDLQSESGMGLKTIYDVAHNIAKIEKHFIDGKEIELCVHRKGATRAFPPNHPDLPEDYKKTGQPVMIPGSMGTSSYVLAGLETGMREAFGTVCHGAGRRMSRSEAKKTITGAETRKKLEEKGIIVRCASNRGLAEEAPMAYKDVDVVVDIVHGAGLAKKVAKLTPIAVVKGG